MEKLIIAILPLAFLVHLRVSEVVMARRSIALGGRPPIESWLFHACKYLSIGVWIGMALQSWGIGFQLAPGSFFSSWLAIGLWICGFGFLCFGRISLGRHVRIGLPEESTALHTGGAYRFSRNPMYAGLDLTMIAAILYTRNPAILALGAFVIAAHHRIILAEERWLLSTFGQAYERYRERVGRYATLRIPGGAALRMRSLGNLLKMGHCAPTVMRTLLDFSGSRKDWLVRLAAGLPGGIGNTGGECGGITAALVLLGLRHGLGRIEEGLPLVMDQGLDHLQRFGRRNSTLLCREIRDTPTRLWPCIRTILRSPRLAAQVLTQDRRLAVTGEARLAYRRLYAAFEDSRFHCAHAVLRKLRRRVPAELLDATGAFLGGTVFQGLTCSALSAGVMALGLRIGEIESSRRRVLWMVALLLTGGPAFDNRINKFNRTMNLGGELADWFAGEFGSTQCRALTKTDFSSTAEVDCFLRDGGIGRCRCIAEKVAERVALLLEDNRRPPAL